MHQKVEKKAMNKVNKDSLQIKKDRQMSVQEMQASSKSSKLATNNIE